MDEVSQRLIKWFHKKWTTGQNRNNNLYILSSSFNDYGVSKDIALSYCNNYISSDFSEKEIEKLVNSAYKKTENFGKNCFEDSFLRLGLWRRRLVVQCVCMGVLVILKELN